MHQGSAARFPKARRSGSESGPSSLALGSVAAPVAQPTAYTPLSSPAQPGLRVTWLPAGRAALPSNPPLASAAARSGPPYSTEGLAGPSLRVRPSPIRSTVFLSNRFESPGRGWSLGNHRGDEARTTNRRRVPVPTGPPPLTVANPQAALRQPGGGGLWVKRRKQPTNQVAPTPYPHLHPPRIWFTAWSAGSSAAADWLPKAWSHPSDPKVLEGGGGGGPVQSASRKPPVGTPRC